MSSTISVEPIYGWGWADGLQTMEPPDGFLVTVDCVGRELIGQIKSGVFAGQTIVMSKRHEGPFDGFVNVSIQGDGTGKNLSGFAEISKDSMK